MAVINFKKISDINKDYMTMIEAMFFNSDRCEIDYAKVDINSDDYDPEYESSVRKSDICALYVLDEVMLQKNDSDSEILNYLSSVEDLLVTYFSSNHPSYDEYRCKTSTAVHSLCKASYDALKLSSQVLTDNEYSSFKGQFPSITMPPSKEAFLGSVANVLQKLSAAE